MLKLYYDGACPLCAREIRTYRRIDPLGLEFDLIDITAPEFNALREGLDPLRVLQTFHLKDENGAIFQGIDAFAEIWKRIPKMRWLAHFVKAPLIYLLMKLGYAIFAKIRPRLPGRCPPGRSGRCRID